jgi:hypothetical protein
MPERADENTGNYGAVLSGLSPKERPALQDVLSPLDHRPKVKRTPERAPIAASANGSPTAFILGSA